MDSVKPKLCRIFWEQRGIFSKNSGNFGETFREYFGNFPGNFPGIFGETFREHFGKLSGNFRGNFPGIFGETFREVFRFHIMCEKCFSDCFVLITHFGKTVRKLIFGRAGVCIHLRNISAMRNKLLGRFWFQWSQITALLILMGDSEIFHQQNSVMGSVTNDEVLTLILSQSGLGPKPDVFPSLTSSS